MITWKRRKLLQSTPHEKHILIISPRPPLPFLLLPPFPPDVIRGQVETLGFYHHQVIAGNALLLLLRWYQWQFSGELDLQTCPALVGGITLPQICQHPLSPKRELRPPSCTGRRNILSLPTRLSGERASARIYKTIYKVLGRLLSIPYLVLTRFSIAKYLRDGLSFGKPLGFSDQPLIAHKQSRLALQRLKTKQNCMKTPYKVTIC